MKHGFLTRANPEPCAVCVSFQYQPHINFRQEVGVYVPGHPRTRDFPHVYCHFNYWVSTLLNPAEPVGAECFSQVVTFNCLRSIAYEVECVSVCREGLKANVDLLVNLQGLEDAAQLKIEAENSTAVAFIDGTT